MTDGTLDLCADDRISASGMRPKDPFLRRHSRRLSVHPMESAYRLPPDQSQLHCKRFRVTINSSEGVRMGNFGCYQRGMAEQHIKEGNNVIRWTKMSPRESRVLVFVDYCGPEKLGH